MSNATRRHTSITSTQPTALNDGADFSVSKLCWFNERDDDDAPPRRQHRQRLYAEWAVSLSGRPATERLVARVILNQQDGYLRRTCRSSLDTIAHNASLKLRTVENHLRQLCAARVVERRNGFAVVIDTATAEPHAKRMLACSPRRARRFNAGRWTALDRAVERMRGGRFHGLPHAGEPCRDDALRASGDHYEPTCALCRTTPRLLWLHSLLRTTLDCNVKIIATAVALAIDASGRPHRHVTSAELLHWAGMRDRRVLRAALHTLGHEWLMARSLTGRDGGYVLRLTAPERVRAEWGDDINWGGFNALQ